MTPEQSADLNEAIRLTDLLHDNGVLILKDLPTPVLAQLAAVFTPAPSTPSPDDYEPSVCPICDTDEGDHSYCMLMLQDDEYPDPEDRV